MSGVQSRQPHIDPRHGQPPRAEGAPAPVAARRRGEFVSPSGGTTPTLIEKPRVCTHPFRNEPGWQGPHERHN
eukprot:4378002-Pyramimonas_sp.AAC.1